MVPGPWYIIDLLALIKFSFLLKTFIIVLGLWYIIDPLALLKKTSLMSMYKIDGEIRD